MIPYQKLGSIFRRTIVCGDIHGCYEALQAFLNTLSFSPDDLLISVGDILDRGP